MMITIKDIAEMAQVSKGTVSRVINGAPGVGDETRKRILKMIKELDFQPNASAQGLAAKHTNNIGLVIPDIGKNIMANNYWPVMLTEITLHAAVRDYNLLFSTARSEKDRNSAYKSILKGRKIDGLIIDSYQFGEKQMAELLLKDFPYVFIGRNSYITSNYVDIDGMNGSRLMTEHLIRLGHKEIAILSGSEQFINIHERIQGFKDAMIQAGLNPRYIFHCPYRIGDIIEETKRILQQKPRPTALFAIAEDLAIGVLKAIHEMGLKIPDDIAVVFFDDLPMYEFYWPSITAIRQPITEIA
ncbi:MAG TPA: LacI family DNA-binding transcriptional regulator, partial [Bacillota bacterium]|nr:LacI family DNA-binding transcriptional regulator [Bacillota bacterium]